KDIFSQTTKALDQGSYGIRLNSSQPRHPGRAVAPYPGSQKALAFVTVPDNAFGVSGMTRGSEAV
ncbi:MAG: hypothetical protein WCC41_20975, partial [Rhodomicrobium sp.]